MAWHELPLMLFTVFAQTAVGAFILMSVVLLRAPVEADVRVRIIKSMFFLWVLMGIGFAVSTGHLGSPFRAINALNRIGSSWLSNEIFFGSLFFAAGGLFWLAELLNKGSEAARKGLMVAAAVLGAIFMFAMIRVYMIDTVPTWNVVYTPLSFVITVIVSGCVFGHMLLTGAKYNSSKLDGLLSVVGIVAVVISVIVSLGQINQLGTVQTAIASASDLLPDIGTLKSAYIVLLAAAVIIWVKPALTAKGKTFAGLATAVALVLVAEFLNRAIFYSLHMSVGL